MPLNLPKRLSYWNSTSGFDFDHITAVDMSLCTSLRSFIQIGPPSAEKNDVMSIFKVADFRHFGFQGSNNGLFEKPMYDFLDRSSIETIAVNCLDKDEQQWKRLNWFNSQRVRVQCRMRTATCDDNETTTLLIDVVRPPTSDLWLLRAEVVHLPSPNSSVRFVCQLRTRLSNHQPSY